MRINKFAILGVFAIASTLFSSRPARADGADQATKLTFSQPVEVPGVALQAGTYLFKVDPDERNIVRIFDADGTHFYATVQTISAERLVPTDGTVVTLAKQTNGAPDALVKWFYPGTTFGHEFVYSKHEEQQIAQERQRTILAEFGN